MRDMLRETISDGETPHINGVGDVSMPTASLDEHYVDRLVLVAECMKEMAQKLNELMRQLDVFTDQIGDRSLNDIRSVSVGERSSVFTNLTCLSLFESILPTLSGQCEGETLQNSRARWPDPVTCRTVSRL